MKKILLALLAVASPAFAQDQAAAARTAAGCGPSQMQFDVRVDDKQHPQGQPDAGKALVYVFEDWINGPTIRVGLNGIWVGALKDKSYFSLMVTPGDQNVCVQWQANEQIGAAKKCTFEAGKVYYIRITFYEERPARWMKLELEDSAEGQFLIGSSMLSTYKQKK